MTHEIDKIKGDMEEYMGKAPVIGESMIGEMETLKGVVNGQREEI